MYEGFPDSEASFVKDGFKNWKKAMESDRGFRSHAKSRPHMAAELQWNKQKQRDANNETILEQLGSEVYVKRRYYIRSIAEAIQFLIVNELSFRGNYNEDIHREDGLFNKIFALFLKQR